MATLAYPAGGRPSGLLRHLDLGLLASTFALQFAGAWLIYFGTAEKLRFLGYDPAYYMKRDILYVAVGTIALAIAAAVDYRVWKGFIPFLYAGTLLSLLAVLSPLGTRNFGAKSWFSTPFFGLELEPAELAKPAMILVLAFTVAERRGEMEVRDVARTLGLLLPAAFLVFIQPDFGTTLVFLAIALGILLVGGTRARHLFVLLGIGVVVVAVMLQGGLLQEYQVKRLTAFVSQSDQATPADGPGYNVQQAKAAVSAGGLFGRGPGNSTQTNLGFVPVQESDFIFTVTGELFGFVGCTIFLGIYGFFIWRAWRVATLARDQFGALVATGAVAMLAFQMFINVGMTLGMMPVTGLPLPLVSLGGSSMLASCISVGLLLNIHMRRFL